MSTNSFALPDTMRINGLAELKDQLTPLVQADQDLELDGEAVASLDTSGLQLIIAAHISLSKAGHKLTVKNASEALNKAIDICNARDILQLV
mgnify:CR=1 FL=1